MSLPLSPSALLFDLDGTLVDSLPEIHRCVIEAYQKHQLSPWPTEAEVLHCMGQGIYKLATQLLERHPTPHEVSVSALSDSIRKVYKARGTESHLKNIAVYPGVREQLAELCVHYPMAIVTNRPEAHAIALLQALSLASKFRVILGQKEGYPTKPNPSILYLACDTLQVDPIDCILIGDSRFDLEAARAVPMQFLWARYGYWQPQQGQENNNDTPAYILDTFNDIVHYIALTPTHHAR